LRNIEMMSPHIGECSTGIFLIRSPLWKMLVNSLRTKDLVVTSHRSWADPHIPVRTFGNIFRCQVAWLGWFADADSNPFQITDTAIPDVFHRLAKAVPELASLLAARLENDAGLRDFAYQLSPLSYIMRQWLFTVDVFSRASGQDALNRVPVIRCADHDGIQSIEPQQLAKVDKGFQPSILAALGSLSILGFDGLDRMIDPIFDNIAHRHDFNLLVAEELIQVSQALLPDSDEAKGYPIRGGMGPRDRRCDPGRGRQQCRGRNKFAA
jgi:hypothetical protein